MKTYNTKIRNHIAVIYDIINEAKKQIKQQTELDVRISFKMLTTSDDMLEALLVKMCECWNINPIDLKNTDRSGNMPSYRKLYCMAAKHNYPRSSLIQIGAVVGYTDHSVVIHNLNEGYNWLQTGDDKFSKLFEKVKHFFYEEIQNQVQEVATGNPSAVDCNNCCE